MLFSPEEAKPNVDAEVFPTTAAWLASLPDGLNSYATVQTRREYNDCITRDFPLAPEHPRLPASIAKAIRFETDDQGWISDLHCLLHEHVVFDLYFEDKKTYYARHFQWCSQTLNGPFYRAVMFCVSPKLTMIALGGLWSRLNRGTQVSSREGPVKNSRYMTLSFPKNLYDDFLLEAVVVAVKAAVPRPSGRHFNYEIIEVTPTSGTCLFRW